MKIHVCDYCHLQNNGGGISPAVVTRTLTVEGVTYEVDVCQAHDDKWYGPLVELLRKIGSVAHDATPGATERRKVNADAVLGPVPEPVDGNGFVPPRNYETPDVGMVSADKARKRRGRIPKERFPHLPKPGPNGKIVCPKPGCTTDSKSPGSIVEHMRRSHPVWYYSDESRQWRPAGSRGEVHICDVCGEPGIGAAGVALHMRKTHPREYKAAKAAKVAKPGPPT